MTNEEIIARYANLKKMFKDVFVENTTLATILSAEIIAEAIRELKDAYLNENSK